MLYVWDNGESYSDHSLYFIETEWPREVVERALKYRDTCGSLVMMAEDGAVTWFEGGCGSMTLEAACWLWRHERLHEIDVPPEFKLAVARHQIKHLEERIADPRWTCPPHVPIELQAWREIERQLSR